MPRNAESGKNRLMPHFTLSSGPPQKKKAKEVFDIYCPAGMTPQPSPTSRRNQILRRATGRIASLSGSRSRQSKIPVPSPDRTRESSLILSSPSRRASHLPEPTKKEPLESPSNKPLPSLPVASFVPSSPVHRRSLLDATDIPLRHSVSPGVVVDWPTLSPVKPNNLYSSHSRCTMTPSTETLQSSLGESVIERMRKLKLENENSKPTQIPCIRSRSKVNPQNHTPKELRTYTANPVINSTYVLPEGPTETPRGMKRERVSLGSSFSKPASSQKQSVSKTSTSIASGIPGSTNIEPRSDGWTRHLRLRPQHENESTGQEVIRSDKRSSALSPIGDILSIPRSAKQPTTPKSPCATKGSMSTKVVKLKHSHGQVNDVAPKPSNKENENGFQTEERRMSYAMRGACYHTRLALPIVDDNNLRRELADGHQASSSEGSTVRQYSTSPSSSCSTKSNNLKENVSPSKPKDGAAEMRHFRFPATPNKEDANDSGSEITCVTSNSSASKTGTIYAQDESGSYRLKPVSKNDPRNGPRVRIENSADRFLLDGYQLVEAEARHAGHQSKITVDEIDKPVASPVPELAHLSPILQDKGEHTTTRDSLQDQAVPATWMHSAQKSMSGKDRRLAPTIPAEIPALTHSPTGWPLYVSKIAPFAEIAARDTPSKPRSVSERNLKVAPNTPRKESLKMVAESPSSAYTIRTALQKGPNVQSTIKSSTAGTALKVKTRKSLPNINSGPLLHSRPVSKAHGPYKGLRKQTSDLLRSYVDQRADHPSPRKKSKADAASRGNEYAPVANGVDIRPSPKHMQTYKDSVRQQDPHNDHSTISDQPSSPHAVPSTVHTGKVRMLNSVRGLFHKYSRDGTLSPAGSHSSETHQTSESGHGSTEGHKPSPSGSPVTPEQPASISAEPHSPARALQPTPATLTTTAAAAIPPSHKSRLARLATSRPLKQKSSSSITTTATANDSAQQPFLTSALEPLEIHSATTLAFSLLDRARAIVESENDSDAERRRKEQYIELAKMVVSVVQLAREAEKAKEEANAAAARAERECVRVIREVGGVCELVGEVLEAERKG